MPGRPSGMAVEKSLATQGAGHVRVGVIVVHDACDEELHQFVHAVILAGKVLQRSSGCPDEYGGEVECGTVGEGSLASAARVLVIGVHPASLAAATDNHPDLRGRRLPAAPDAEPVARLHRWRFGRSAFGSLRLAACNALSLRLVGGLPRARPTQPVPVAGPRGPRGLLPAGRR